MEGLTIEDAVVRYSATPGSGSAGAVVTAVDGVSLDVQPGEVVALLGASGSGKSSLLRAIAGLEPLAEGRVAWGDEDVTAQPTHKRNFGMMFQDAQLFPNMNVGRNVAYGLHGWDRLRRRRRVEELLELVGLPGYGKRKVTELSGGQAQRVALARSLAPSPRLLLLDEPLSALDRGLREHMVNELSRGLRATSTTAVYVTHDQDEASTIADRVAVLDAGRLLQLDTPEVLWRRPLNRRVAEFLGYEPFVDAAVAARLGLGGVSPGDLVGLGQEALSIVDDGGVRVRVVGQTLRRGRFAVSVELPGGQQADVPHERAVEEDYVGVVLHPDATVLVPAE